MELPSLPNPEASYCQDKGTDLEDISDRVPQDFPGLLSPDEVEFLMDELRNCSESQDRPQQNCSSPSPNREDGSKGDDSPEKIDPTQLKDEIEKGQSGEKPSLSYIALISLAILSSRGSRMVLGDIYSWVSNNFPYFKLVDRSWRNSIRHNLSLNECFIKAGRCENGKGNYWSVHPANMDDFRRGDFRRRRARIQVRKSNEKTQKSHSQNAHILNKQQGSHYSEYEKYVPMTQLRASDATIISMFGPQVLVDKRPRKSGKVNRDCRSDSDESSRSTNVATPASSTSSTTPPPSTAQGASGADLHYYTTPTIFEPFEISSDAGTFQNQCFTFEKQYTNYPYNHDNTYSQMSSRMNTQTTYDYFNGPTAIDTVCNS